MGRTDGNGSTSQPSAGSSLPPHLNPRGRPDRPATRSPTPAGPPPTGLPPTGPAPTGPPPTGRAARRPRRRAARVLSWIAVLTSVAVLASAGAGYALLRYYDRNINRIDVFGADSGDRSGAANGARNILIVGSDSRGDLAPGEGTQGTGENFVTGQRSDTVILAHLYGDSDTAQLVSFPRDSWVPIPTHTSSATGKQVPQRTARLNTAFFEGGPSLLIQTIEALTDLQIDNYLQIDFDGFQAMVNTLGGVEVCLSKAAKEADSGIDLQAGRQTVKGEQALAFVRQRKGLPGGDIDRIGRQQQFIGAIVRKTLSAGTLLNPFKLNGVISAATESLIIDEDLSIGDLRTLALRFRSFDAGGVIFSTVPVADPAARRGGASVVLLDESKSAVLFDSLRRDIAPNTPEPAKPGAAPDQPLLVAPAAIQVKVFNGAAVQGLGRRAYEDLATLDFQLVGQPDNRGSSATQTVVVHGPDKADSARTVAAAIPGATTRLDPELGRTVEVVVGAAYSGTRPVTVGAPKQPSPTGSAPPVQTAAQDPCSV